MHAVMLEYVVVLVHVERAYHGIVEHVLMKHALARVH